MYEFILGVSFWMIIFACGGSIFLGIWKLKQKNLSQKETYLKDIDEILRGK